MIMMIVTVSTKNRKKCVFYHWRKGNCSSTVVLHLAKITAKLRRKPQGSCLATQLQHSCKRTTVAADTALTAVAEAGGSGVVARCLLRLAGTFAGAGAGWGGGLVMLYSVPKSLSHDCGTR